MQLSFRLLIISDLIPVSYSAMDIHGLFHPLSAICTYVLFSAYCKADWLVAFVIICSYTWIFLNEIIKVLPRLAS